LNKIVLATPREAGFSALAAALAEDAGTKLFWVKSGAAALSFVAGETPDLVIVDEELGDMSGLGFVRKLITVNAMVNAAVASSLTEEEFHETAEGLGVMFRLPLNPGRENAEKLLDRLGAVKNSVSG
jgi:DNA-binding response OmpR family regulator